MEAPLSEHARCGREHVLARFRASLGLGLSLAFHP